MWLRDNLTWDLLENALSVGTWSLEVGSSLVEWSQGVYDIHEKSADEPVPVESAIDYYVPEHRPVIRNCVERAMQQGESWDVELQIVTERGNTRWVRAVGAPVYRGGAVHRVHGAFQDIDIRKQLEIQRQHTLALMVEGERAAKLGHWKVELATGAVEWTPGVFSLSGFAEAGGAPSPEEYFKRIHPDDRQAAEDGVDSWGVDQQPPRVVKYRMLVEGHYRHFRVTEAVLRDSEGKACHHLGTIVDETESVEAERRHDQLRRRHAIALEASRIGVWDWDLTSNELIWDQQMFSLYGITERQCDSAYAAWVRGLHPEDKEAATATLQAAIEAGGKFDTQFRVVWPSGEVRVIRALAQTQLGSDGKPSRVIGVNWDITDSEHNKRELERSNHELAQLAYRASHDIKAPLTTIKRLAQYAIEDIDAGQWQRASRDLALVVRQADSLEQLVLGILEVARADISSTTVEEVALEALVQEVSESLAAACADNGVTITSRVLARGNYKLQRVRIYQILANLVANSVRYCDPAREERRVSVEVSEQPKGIRITVADNGLGIPSGVQESIYEMFKTFHSTRVSGSGIGMYIVRKHVEMLGGAIEYESSREGTTFRVDLPLSGLR